MRNVKLIVLFVAAGIIVGGLNGHRAPAAQQEAPNDRARLSYGVGLYLGRDIRQGLRLDGVDADLDLVVRGFTDGLLDREPAMDEDELEAVLQAVHREMQARAVKRRLAEDPEFKRLHDQNLARSKAYHKQHQYDPGVVTLPSGVQYKVLATGDGPSPTVDDVVVITFRLERLDGTLIDEGREVEVEVSSLSAGGREILPMMRVGDKWHVAVPPHMAYGAGGDPPVIGPHETLIAEVELLGVRRER